MSIEIGATARHAAFASGGSRRPTSMWRTTPA